MNVQQVSGYNLNFGVKGGNVKQNVLTTPLSEEAKKYIINTIQREYGEVVDPKFLRLDYVGLKNGVRIRIGGNIYRYLNKKGNTVKQIDYGTDYRTDPNCFYIIKAEEFLPSGSFIRKWYDPETCQMCTVEYLPKYEPGKISPLLDFEIEDGEVLD